MKHQSLLHESIKLHDALVISTVSNLLNPLSKQIISAEELDIDLSIVKNIDSAGIAFLLELKSKAKQEKCKISFTNIPYVVNRLCQLYQITL